MPQLRRAPPCGRGPARRPGRRPLPRLPRRLTAPARAVDPGTKRGSDPTTTATSHYAIRKHLQDIAETHRRNGADALADALDADIRNASRTAYENLPPEPEPTAFDTPLGRVYAVAHGAGDVTLSTRHHRAPAEADDGLDLGRGARAQATARADPTGARDGLGWGLHDPVRGRPPHRAHYDKNLWVTRTGANALTSEAMDARIEVAFTEAAKAYAATPAYLAGVAQAARRDHVETRRDAAHVRALLQTWERELRRAEADARKRMDDAYLALANARTPRGRVRDGNPPEA